VIYEGASYGLPAGKCQPGTTVLYGTCVAYHPSFHGLGCYNDRTIRGQSLVPSLHRDGRAFDCGIVEGDEVSIAAMDELCEKLIANHETLGVQQIIFDGRYWRVGNSDWLPFKGSSGPHRDHAHIELTIEKSQSLDIITATTALLGLGDIEMDDATIQKLAQAIAFAIWNYPINDNAVPASAWASYLKQEVGLIRRQG
jgi:hypothetical protein